MVATPIFLRFVENDQSQVLPTTIYLEGSTMALATIEGRLDPPPNKPIYICCDWALNTVVEDKLNRAIRCIKLKNQRFQYEFKQLIKLKPCKKWADDIRVYLTDANGNILSFDYFRLNCTLVLEKNE